MTFSQNIKNAINGPQLSDEEKLKILNEFSNRLNEQTIELDPEISRAMADNIKDLLA